MLLWFNGKDSGYVIGRVADGRRIAGGRRLPLITYISNRGGAIASHFPRIWAPRSKPTETYSVYGTYRTSRARAGSARTFLRQEKRERK
jgi:hypothetical protein